VRLRLRIGRLLGLVFLCSGLVIGPSCSTKKKASEEPTVASALPGAIPVPAQTAEKIAARLASLDDDYQPRTRHLRGDGGPKYSNRLVLESSPYLRQHAHNPVDWFPWGAEAFAVAKKLKRPILLSVGYSTCHWCHVMEEESFEDEEIARYLNENYVAIKVDREERPDVDAIYMRAVQLLTNSGGWPMTVWLTPEKEPFHGATYIPPRKGVRGARKGFIDYLREKKAEFDESPGTVADRASKLSKRIKQIGSPPVGGKVDAEKVLLKAANYYRRGFDPTFGGIRGKKNKFPSSFPNRFLLRMYRRTGDAQFRDMAGMTLTAMASGGIHDHLGGGFHRYTVDPRWMVPHFEKMLYDNALLVMAYLDGAQAAGDPFFAAIAQETLDYVTREMTSPDGTFYSATDADSENEAGHKEEGAFFVWTPQQFDEVLTADEAKLAKLYFRVVEGGNFEHGTTVLSTPQDLTSVASQLQMDVGTTRAMMASIKSKLYAARKEREPPLRDDKIITSWNALMISAFARASQVLSSDSAKNLEVAIKAATFILTELRRDGRLLRTFNDGQARLNAYLEDYAFTIQALLDLFDATGEVRWIDEAIALEKVVQKHYEDPDNGGFFQTSDDHESLLVRNKPSRDGALPSGNSVHALNLLRLYELTTEAAYLERADKTIAAFSRVLERAPASMSEMLLAVDFRSDAAKEIVLVQSPDDAGLGPLLDVLAGTYVPNHVLVRVTSGLAQTEIEKRLPLVVGKRALRGKTTAYVCEQQRCELPTGDPQVFAQQLAKVKALGKDKGAAEQPGVGKQP
jgi:uncharacterized protein YyaL (SSP411 family)